MLEQRNESPILLCSIIVAVTETDFVFCIKLNHLVLQVSQYTC